MLQSPPNRLLQALRRLSHGRAETENGDALLLERFVRDRDLCDLQPVAMNNVFYVTSKENAAKLQREIDRRRHGDPPVPGGPGGPIADEPKKGPAQK